MRPIFPSMIFGAGLLISILCTAVNTMSSQGVECVPKDGLCGCVFKDAKSKKSMMISLSGLDRKDGQAYFQNIGDTSSIYKYYINLCTGFNYPKSEIQANECSDVTGCQVAAYVQSLQYPIAKPNTQSYGTYSPNERFKVTYESVGSRQMTLLLTCDPNVDGKVTSIGDSGSNCVVDITSKHVCPQPYSPGSGGSSGNGGLSAGSIILIVFFVVIVVYLVSGTLFMKYNRKATGKELMPNVYF